MRFFTTLVYALTASVLMVSAARIQGRNALRMAQGLPPLPPRMSTRTGTARRTTPSSVLPLSFDSSFEDDSSTSPWIYGQNSERGTASDSTPANTGSHFGLMQVTDASGLIDTSISWIRHPLTLITGANYALTFSEYFEVISANSGSCNNVVLVDGSMIWSGTYSSTSTQYTQHSALPFTAKGTKPTLTFTTSCKWINYRWLIDDVSVTMTSSPVR
ncbi:hypothetical protein DL96DRAFT_1565181 [Flagelloscypha sp. PMI_526]|nr:hypothetical protein DL96DRAFT_1565181 [Flagelloscypha sp. PMI_526]